MCPSMTGTRLVWALTTAGCGVRPPSLAEDLQRLRFDLLFLAADERDDVAKDVERRHARISRTRHRLHRRDHHGPEVEARAAAQAPCARTMVEQLGLVTMAPRQPFGALLLGQDVEVVGVDLRE